MISVLRLGHRAARDKRVSTHVGLVARAFGAERIVYTGEEDEHLLSSLKKVKQNWGGRFRVEYRVDWRPLIRKFKGKVVHLTMYGLPFEKKIGELRGKDLLVIVGGEKVPGEVYGLADYNLAVGNQPHSEVAALAVFLHELFKGKELRKRFKGAKQRVIPREKGKRLEKI